MITNLRKLEVDGLREETQITKIRNESRNTTTNSTKSKGLEESTMNKKEPQNMGENT